MKKYILPFLIVTIIVQLLVPTYMIWNKYDVMTTGEEFKFKVASVDPYDAFRGRYVTLNYSSELDYDNGKYGTIIVDKDGFAQLQKITQEKPAEGVYVKSVEKNYFIMPIDRYYMDEKMAPKAEELTRQIEPGKEAYVVARIKNGSLVITGLFFDGVAIENIINN